jgi:hypothetical protein
MKTFKLTVDMRDRRDGTITRQSIFAPGANHPAASWAAESLGMALAVCSGGVLLCIATQVIDTKLDWSIPMIDADEREIYIDWDEEYPHD